MHHRPHVSQLNYFYELSTLNKDALLFFNEGVINENCSDVLTVN